MARRKNDGAGDDQQRPDVPEDLAQPERAAVNGGAQEAAPAAPDGRPNARHLLDGFDFLPECPPRDADLEQDEDDRFPDLDDPGVLGLVPTAIAACADGLYIHSFECALRAADALIARLEQDETLAGDAGCAILRYEKQLAFRFPPERRRRTLEAVFEGGDEGDGPPPFVRLMLRLGDAVADYDEAHRSGRAGRKDAARSPERQVVRAAILDLQLHLSHASGALLPYLVDEAAGQLTMALELLMLPAVQGMACGTAAPGLFEIIAELDPQAGDAIDVARRAELGVHGRKALRVLAAPGASAARRRHIARLQRHMYPWLAAYRGLHPQAGASQGDGAPQGNGAGRALREQDTERKVIHLLPRRTPAAW